jgi:hypothetical protein
MLSPEAFVEKGVYDDPDVVPNSFHCFCYRTENMSELSCDGIPPGKMEADAQWYPFVMVTKPDDWRRPCPSASSPIAPSNGPWRMPCTRAATVTTSGT